MTDTTIPIDNVTPLRPRNGKDRTNAERSRRFRAKRKAQRKRGTVAQTVALPMTTVASVQVPGQAPVPVSNPVDPHHAPNMHHDGGRRLVDILAYVAAIALAGAAARFSIRGMTILFPGSPMSVIGMAVAMEFAKLITAAWLAARWRATAWIWRVVLIVLIAGLATINATGVYAQLVAAHVGVRGATTSALDTQTATIDARIAAQAHVVEDIDRRIQLGDRAIEEAAKRGRTKTALEAMDSQRKSRMALQDERKTEGAALAALQAERAQVDAKGRQVETEAAPIRYVAEALGLDTDPERAIRWLIALIVLCCDPLAIAITAATSARRMR